MHNWNISPSEARTLQEELRTQITIEPLKKEIRIIAGADVSFNKYEKDVYAGIIVLSYPDLREIEYSLAKVEVNFPYIPGLLSFREIPALLECWEKLSSKPDVVVVDGHGIAHPRRMGIATHFGLVTNTPTIGVAKKKLYGTYEKDALEKYGKTNLIDPKTQEHIGIIYRSKTNTNPLFISLGHLLTHDEAFDIVKTSLRGYKLPEQTRQAHLLVNKFRKGEL